MSCRCDSDDIELVKGTEYTLSVLYKNDAGAPINLTGLTVRLAIRWPSYRSANAAPVQADGYTISSSAFGADGAIEFMLAGEDTAAFPVSCVAQAGPPIAYQLVVEDDLILNGAVRVSRNLYEENQS